MAGMPKTCEKRLPGACRIREKQSYPQKTRSQSLAPCVRFGGGKVEKRKRATMLAPGRSALGLAMAVGLTGLASAFMAPLQTHLSQQHQHQQGSVHMISPGEDNQAAADAGASEVSDSSSGVAHSAGWWPRGGVDMV